MSDKTIDETIRVFIRQRPQTVSEKDSGAGIQLGDEENLRGNLQLRENGACTYAPPSKTGATGDTKDKFAQEYKYKFDSCYGTSSTQQEIYEGTAKSIVQSALEGYSGTIFAYGPTNSGKTYTMRGGGQGVGGQQGSFSKGVMERAVEDLLDGLGAAGGELWASYLQIYCEAVSDLLIGEESGGGAGLPQYTPPTTAVGGGGMAAIAALKQESSSAAVTSGGGSVGSATDLTIREKDGKVYVEGAQRRRLTSVRAFGELLLEGDDNRATAETNMNEASSRSHTVLMLSVMVPEGKVSSTNHSNSSGSQPQSFKESTVLMVDLAGCERAEASAGKHYKRKEEARSINLSLTSLGNCMNALAEQRKHVPYRDSKLTRLLQGSLGVGARTSVIVTLPPSQAENFDQSALPVLRFSARAMKVTVSAKVNRFVDYKALYDKALKALADKDAEEKEQQQSDLSSLLLQYETDLAKAQEEVTLLRRQLLSYKGGSSGSAGEHGPDVKSSVFIKDGDSSNNQCDSSSSSSGGDSGDSTYWRNQIDTLTEMHLKESEALREEKDRKARVLNRQLDESREEVDQLRTSLKKERESHLETAQRMRGFQQSNNALESEHQGRLEELLSENSEQREQLESQAEAMDMYREQNSRMKSLLQSEIDDSGDEGEGGGGTGGSVPREKFEELQTMFVETVERLTSRVMQLEEGHATNPKPPSGQQRSMPPGGGRYAPSSNQGNMAGGARKQAPIQRGQVRGEPGARGGGGFGVQGGGYGRR
jgi:hypothetical protein